MAKYKIIPSSRTIVQLPISIGHKAEKGVEAIEFDLTAWVETYGSGTLTVIMKRWGDAIPYPIALEIDEDNKATWTLSDIDTAKAGMAYAQLSYIVGDEVVKKSDIYTFRVMDSLTGEGEPPEAYESWLENLTHIAAEAMAEVLDIEGIVTDKTLTVDGGIADAKAVGDELGAINESLGALDDRVDALKGGGGGLSADVKTALMNLVNHLAWDDDDPTGQTYITALYDALYPPANLVSISAVYTQGGTVYDTDTLDSLKSDLVVTARMSDQTTRPVANYTLSGTLAEGTSTITITYGGKTTTFDVVVSVYTTSPSIAEYGKCIQQDGTTKNIAGCCYTNPYAYTIDIDALKATSEYDSTNDYMNKAGSIYKIEYMFPNSQSVSTSGYNKILAKSSNDVIINYGSVTANSLKNVQDSRYNSKALKNGTTYNFIFSLFSADIEDSYAYFDSTLSGVMPVGVEVGDIIFAGANTPYYGKHNIND